MREIVLDTETTGLDPIDGHRIVEIGCLELINHVPTDKVFHSYVNPLRSMPEGAFAVHGLSEEFLGDKPLFADVCDEFIAFIAGSPLVIHNARFDLKFLNAELERFGGTPLPADRAIDTLEMARKKYPGSPNSLDALCRRFGVDTSVRAKHGALVDSYLLAEVYLELIGGRQPDFDLSPAFQESPGPDQALSVQATTRQRALGPLITQEERREHENFIATKLGSEALWSRLGRMNEKDAS